ncbi:7227_t:CDS:1 [Funneliformis geosporum]|nr:7227_t:CDS:1 [Funneliformis geosporum]
MIKTYTEIKNHNERSGVERKDWEWYKKMDSLFGTCKNISPSFIVNRFTNNENEESLKNECNLPKKSKKNNEDSIAIAISTMCETRERVWDKKIELEREKIEKNHTIEMNKLEVES